MEHGLRHRAVHVSRGARAQEQQHGGWEREPEPGGEGAPVPRSVQANQEPELAARRTRDDLAQREEFGVLMLGQPATGADIRLLEVPQVRDRAAEGGEPEPQRYAKYFERGMASRRRSCFGCAGIPFRHPQVHSKIAMYPKSMCSCMWQ